MSDPVTEANPNITGFVGETLTVDFTFPTGLETKTVDEIREYPTWPAGLNWDETTVTGVPEVAGTYVLTFIVNMTDASTVSWDVTVYILDEHAGNISVDDNEAAFNFPGAYSLQSLVTDKKTYHLGTGVSGPTLANLLDQVNLFAILAEQPFKAQLIGEQFMIAFSGGDVLSSAVLKGGGEAAISPVYEPDTAEESNNDFFGKDDPGDAEYSWYTIIHTSTC